MDDTKLYKSALVLGLVAVACLLGIGLGFSWTAAWVVVVVELLLWLGYWLAGERLAADRERIARERSALDAEWDTFDRTRRVRDVYWHARHAMRDEAQQRYMPNDPQQR